MCSEFLQSMENYKGDLTDIIRGSGGGGIGGSSSYTASIEAAAAVSGDHWQVPTKPTNYSSGIDESFDYFGDPFSNARDPLLHGISIPQSSGFFPSPDTTASIPITGGGGNTNMFSGILQISPGAKLPVSPGDSPVVVAVSPRLKSPTSLISNDLMNSANPKSCLVENSGLQISSPRNTGIKRRKSQAKKVVCIPAPAPASSRQTGEVVPSDLWAWRKYGQKPIKGSPYPRGYYRCSSSKGCSARKQVERSRTDPNMLVITYTSEHNHPWPTQRNALAGSSRSQPVKTSTPKTSSSSASQPHSQNVINTLKEERNGDHISTTSSSLIPDANLIPDPPVKEEMDMEDVEFGEAYTQSYKPSEDFFADLGEIETDSLNLLDPFTFYDWPENNSTSISNTAIIQGEDKKSSQQNY